VTVELRDFDEVFDSVANGFISEVNLAEFYYKTAEKLGLEVANLRCRMIRNSDIKINLSYWRDYQKSWWVKIKYKNKLLLTDCFLISEAENLKAKILTTDYAIKEVTGDNSIYVKI